jgi:hypothetical protein
LGQQYALRDAARDGSIAPKAAIRSNAIESPARPEPIIQLRKPIIQLGKYGGLLLARFKVQRHIRDVG